MNFNGYTTLEEKNYAKILAQTNEQPLLFLDVLKRTAHELCPNYPYKDDDAFEWLYALTEALMRSRYTNQTRVKEIRDLHDIIANVDIVDFGPKWADARYRATRANKFGWGNTKTEAIYNLIEKEKENDS
jgi:hypothetical protein